MKRFVEILSIKLVREAGIPAICLFILLFLPAFTRAQQAIETDPELPDIQQHVAAVKVDGGTLFKVRGISSYPAEQRATAISRRIKEAASDRSVSADSVKIVVMEDYVSIYAGKIFIMKIYSEDAELEHLGKEKLAQLFVQKTAEAIKLSRHDRSRPVLVKKSLTALGSTAVLTLILFLIIWLFRKIDAWIQKRMKAGIDSLENKSFSLIRANQLWKIYYRVIRLFRIIIIILFIGFSANYILGLFPWTSNVANYIFSLLADPVISIGHGFLHFLPDLAFLIVIYFVTRYLLKLSKLLFTGLQRGEIRIRNFDSDWAIPTFRLVKIFMIAFAVILAYPYIPGSDSNAFKGVSVFLGLLFSLGSSSFISNLIAGYTITYRRAFKTGDRIKVEGLEGYVEEQKLLSTRLRSIKNEEIVISNSLLLNSNIINFSARAREKSLIIHTVVGIGYETPWRQVEAMLKESADRTQGLLKDPPPFVLQLLLGDFAIQYEINAYCNDESRIEYYYSDLHQNILDVFNENDVQIMTPAYERDPKVPKVVPQDMWNPPLIKKK